MTGFDGQVDDDLLIEGAGRFAGLEGFEVVAEQRFL